MKAYSIDLRKRVLSMCDQGHGTTEVARVFAVSPAWVRRLKQRRREDGQIAAQPGGGSRYCRLTDQGRKQLRRLIEQRPDRTLAQLQEQLIKQGHVRCGLTTIYRALSNMGWSFKKRRFEPANRIDRTSLSVD